MVLNKTNEKSYFKMEKERNRYLRLWGKVISKLKKSSLEDFENELKKKGWCPNQKSTIKKEKNYKTNKIKYVLTCYAIYLGKRKAFEQKYYSNELD